MFVEVLHLRNNVVADEQNNVGRGAAICHGRCSASTRSKSRRSRDFDGANHQICHAFVCVRRANRSFEATNVLRILPGPFLCTVVVERQFGATGTSCNLAGSFFETHIHIYPAASLFAVKQSDGSLSASTQSVRDFLIKSANQLQPFSARQHRKPNHVGVFEDDTGVAVDGQLSGLEIQIPRIARELNHKHAHERFARLTDHGRRLLIE